MESFKLRCVLLLVGLMTIMNLFSQDKHDYATPLGEKCILPRGYRCE